MIEIGRNSHLSGGFPEDGGEIYMLADIKSVSYRNPTQGTVASDRRNGNGEKTSRRLKQTRAHQWLDPYHFSWRDSSNTVGTSREIFPSAVRSILILDFESQTGFPFQRIQTDSGVSS